MNIQKILITFQLALYLSNFLAANLYAQTLASLKGTIYDAQTKQGLVNVKVYLLNTSHTRSTDVNGHFVFNKLPPGKQLLKIEMAGYDVRTYEVFLVSGQVVDLGIIFLSPELPNLQTDLGFITLSDDDLSDESGQSDHVSGLLQASKDLFQNKAAFDWGQMYYRIRGFDSNQAEVMINGISMNSLFNGRASWAHWGGLNDMLRNQELSFGLSPSHWAFGGLLGSVNINTRASLYRPGFRVSSSYANKTYVGRLMLTYNSGLNKKGLAFSLSASRRWANQASFRGALYDAYSLFSALEYKLNAQNSLNLCFIYSPSKRGQYAPISKRVNALLGRAYNPYWGWQNGRQRNSRIKKIAAPLLLFNYLYQSENSQLSTGIAYQIVKQSSSRLDYKNAANPLPNYWRYLANIAKKPQIDWPQLYQANNLNSNIIGAGLARYYLYQDRVENQSLSINVNLDSKLSPYFSMSLAATYKGLVSENFALPTDLLGADKLEDTNLFNLINGSPSNNNVLLDPIKGVNQKIKYHYNIYSSSISAFAQAEINRKKFDFYISTAIVNTKHQRDGQFLNESYLDSSLGKSKELSFADINLKLGLTYKLSGRHLISLNGAAINRAPFIRNSFINARENNHVVNDLESQEIKALDLNYLYRSSILNIRLSTYFALFSKGTDINYFYAQSGSGSDFFQEEISQLNTQHLGFEYGFEYQASSKVKLYFTGSVGQHTYAKNAKVRVNFDSSADQPDLINSLGYKDLGATYIKGLRLANGPQQALSVGLEYRDPNFWWLGVSANYLSNAYIDISTLIRTADFFIDPKDPFDRPFERVDLELARRLLTQEKFKPVYLLNLVAGKSWRLKGSYLSFFLSLNNAFDQDFKTGGFEQSRTANYAALQADHQQGPYKRNFGNKYWYGSGRTYFLNLAMSF